MIFHYDSLVELRAAWRRLDQDSGAASCTAVLVLDPSFAGHLPSLIQREQRASRLILASADGPFPPVAFGNLLAGGMQTGWDEIRFENDWRKALDQTCRDLPVGEELNVFWPAWRAGQFAQYGRGLPDRMKRPASWSDFETEDSFRGYMV